MIMALAEHLGITDIHSQEDYTKVSHGTDEKEGIRPPEDQAKYSDLHDNNSLDIFFYPHKCGLNPQEVGDIIDKITSTTLLFCPFLGGIEIASVLYQAEFQPEVYIGKPMDWVVDRCRLAELTELQEVVEKSRDEHNWEDLPALNLAGAPGWNNKRGGFHRMTTGFEKGV